MKEKVIFTTALCLSAMTQMMAQNIIGKVMNTKGEPLAFANVVLLNRTDSAFVKGAVSGEDGSFVIDSSCNGGIIKVTSVGYKTVCKDCEGENVGIIKMEEDSKMLGEVVVKSSLPKTILKNGGMTTTIVGSVLEKAGTMENLLDRIPNVSAQNGSIKVFGRGEPVIYINGRQMRDKSELDRLHSDNIKSVANSASTSIPTGFGRRKTRTLLPKSNIRKWGWMCRARRFIALQTRNIVCWLPSWCFPILCWVVSYLWVVNIPTRIALPSIITPSTPSWQC